MGSSDVFVSYAREDESFVVQLVEFLKAAGVTVWFDREQLSPGLRWEEVVEREIRDVRAFLTCLSTKALTKRGYFHTEQAAAAKVALTYPHGSLFIIPVRLDDCSIPDQMRQYHVTDLQDVTGPRLLLRSLSIALGRNFSASEIASSRLVDALHAHYSPTARISLTAWVSALAHVRTFRGHDAGVTGLAATVLDDGTELLATAGYDSTTRLWKYSDTGDSVMLRGRGGPGEPDYYNWPMVTSHSGPVDHVVWARTPEKQVLISGGSSGEIRIWDAATLEQVGDPIDDKPRWERRPIKGMAWGAIHGADVLATIKSDEVTLWAADDKWKIRGRLSVDGHSPQCIAWLDRTDFFATGGFAGDVRFWSGETLSDNKIGQLIPDDGQHVHITCLAWSAMDDGTPIIISGDTDGAIRVWSIHGRGLLYEKRHAHYGWVRTMTVGLVGGERVLLTGGAAGSADRLTDFSIDDRTIRLWRVSDLEPLTEPIIAHDSGLCGCAWGTYRNVPVFFTASGDHTAKMWGPRPLQL